MQRRYGWGLSKRGYDDPTATGTEAAQREETGGRKRENAGSGQDSRQPIDDLRPDFGECCGALR
jgi:hypothetical protein